MVIGKLIDTSARSEEANNVLVSPEQLALAWVLIQSSREYGYILMVCNRLPLSAGEIDAKMQY